MDETYQPINCNDYDNLELACQYHSLLALTLRDSGVLQARANDLASRKNVEYLVADVAGETRGFRFGKIASSSHPQIGTVAVSES